MCSLVVVWNVTGVHRLLCEVLQVFTGCVKCYRCSLVMCNVTCVPWSCVMFQGFSENCIWCYSCSVVVMCNVTNVQWLCVMLHLFNGCCVWCYKCWVVVCDVTGVEWLCVMLQMLSGCVWCYKYWVVVCGVTSVEWLCVMLQVFSSRYYLCTQKSPYLLHPVFIPSLRSFCNVAFETVPMFVWLTMALSRPLKEDHLAIPLSTSLSRGLMVWCPWFCARW